MVVLKHERETMTTAQKYPPRRLLSVDKANKELHMRNKHVRDMLESDNFYLTKNGANDRAKDMAN